MGNKKNILKISLVILLVIALFMGAITILAILVGLDFDFLETLEFYIGSVLVLYIICMTIFLSIIFAFKSGKNAASKEAQEIDFENEKTYYREILERYSVLELAYLNRMTTLKEEDLVAGLLGLELKKAIKLQDNKIAEINRNVHLVTNESHLLGSVINGKLKVDNINFLTQIVEKDAINRGIIQKQSLINKIKDIVIMFIKTNLFLALAIVLFLILEFFLDNPMDELNVIIIFLLSIVTFGIFVFSSVREIYLISYIYHKFKSYELTEKGKEIKLKLNGLKWYIKDFGSLHDNEKETLSLWEDYLIYSVMFGNNRVIMKEMKDILDIKSTIKIKTSTIVFLAIIIIITLFGML